jgi:NADH-quinone oxidoreductase subunit C
MGLTRTVDGLEAVELLRQRFPDAVVDAGTFAHAAWVELAPARIVACATALRDDPGLAFDFLVDVTAVHWPERTPPVEIVYHLYSYRRNDRLRIKLRTGETGPVPTLTGVWAAADWNEREAFDMFGVRFDGHPDLRRILMPDDYTEHPMRKELPLYRG